MNRKEFQHLLREASGEFIPDKDSLSAGDQEEKLLSDNDQIRIGEGDQGMRSILPIDFMISYADLMTLLLVFFVFFFSISHKKQEDVILEQNQVIIQQAKLDSLRMRNEQVYTIPGEFLFDSGRAELKKSSIPKLEEVAKNILAEVATDNNWMIRVEGHTDNVPIKSKRYSSNWELSTARALSVVTYFIEHNYAKPEQIHAIGYAEYKPLVPNDSEENRSKNRRVEIRLTKRFD